MSLLSLRGVSRRFGALQALQDISMELSEGELRAVIGPNGAGKTTLFNLVSGLFPPSAGEIVFDGESIVGMDPARLVRKGMIRTFQITEIFLDLTVFENLRVAVETAMGLNFRPWIGRGLRRQVEGRVEELLQTVRLAAHADRVAGELAHGDQRVLEMGIALSRQPKLLLLDEPTAGMGDEETEHMVGLVRQLHERQRITMLFIEHDMNVIFGVADRITVLNNGRMLAEGTPAEISADERVQAAYLGSVA